ncbi:MAG: hypothetical protein WC279_12390 [Sulfurimonas sp.]|jgi:hypothetical protein|uniref:hypothetical protein n=1 Tax=Sulfurimonas sp. TaxID=2022749 RepID=UPI0035661771
MTERKKTILTKWEKELIDELGHPIYSVKHIEEWINRHDTVDINALAALMCMGVVGYYEAVKMMASKTRFLK